MPCRPAPPHTHAHTQLVGGARHIFHILDQCAIYLLIAGSYTPFMVALFPNKRAWSVGIVAYEWALCAIGVAIELIFHKARSQEPWIKYFSLSLCTTQ